MVIARTEYPPQVRGTPEKKLRQRFARVKMFRCLLCPGVELTVAQAVPHLIAVHSIGLIQPLPKPPKRFPREK